MSICEQLRLDVKMGTQEVVIFYQARIRLHWNWKPMAVVK